MAELPIPSRQPLGPVLGLDEATHVPVFYSHTLYAQCTQPPGIHGCAWLMISCSFSSS